MRHFDFRWGGAVAALLAVSADAQLLPQAPLKPVTQVLQVTKSTTQKVLAVPQTLVPAVTNLVPKVTNQLTNIVGKTVGTVTTITSPLLKTPLSRPASAITISSPTLAAPHTQAVAPLTGFSGARLQPLPPPPTLAEASLANSRVQRLRMLIGSSGERLDTDDLG